VDKDKTLQSGKQWKNRNKRYKNKTHNPDRQSTVNHKMQYKQITTQTSKTRLLKDRMAIIGHK